MKDLSMYIKLRRIALTIKLCHIFEILMSEIFCPFSENVYATKFEPLLPVKLKYI